MSELRRQTMDRCRTRVGVVPLVVTATTLMFLWAYESPLTGQRNAQGGRGSRPDSAGARMQEADVRALRDFEVQLLYEVPLEDEGSWVALSVLPNGDLIASDQEDAGLYRISVSGDVDNPEVDVEKLVMPISGAQGLLYAFDRLYVNVSGVGLFQLSSSRGGELNTLTYVEGSPDGEGEHGNHALIPTEDGKGLYALFGNHTSLPDSYTSRVASWNEDLLLPRNWDARGHARGILAPGGYITRIDPDASEWEIVTMGFRNPYDVAINQQGELFTYDADMEWDMGMPWYRPTRIVHAVSGSDWGWRSGSGKWKAYYEDSLPPALRVGPGSPTGLVFGTGARFPAKYQRALFALDWTFGTMWAIHLTPKGASYSGHAEEFLAGSPLPLTDAVIGGDGHMYFTTGGRGGASGLWRVVYRGDASTASAEPIDDAQARQAREQRRQLEAFHGQKDSQAVDIAWPYLDSDDRFLRHAARVAIEWQPVDTWAERALNEERPQARITALTALARSEAKSYREDALQSVMELDVAELSADQQLNYLRAMSLVFMRLGDPSDQQRTQMSDTLQALLPNEDERVNVELVRTLVYLDDPRVIEKALTLMQRDTPSPGLGWDESLLKRSERYGGTIMEMLNSPPPTDKLEYAYMLRNMRNGWTMDQRRRYFAFINESADRAGGLSYTGFLELTREEALKNASEEEMAAVSELTGVSLAREPDFDITPPKGPGREWTVEEAVEVVEDHLANQDFERGRSLYHAVSCASCHRFGGYGGNIGPDLSSVGNRFDEDEILEDIIDPNRIISDQYGSSEVTLKNGQTITGLVVKREDTVEIYTRDPNAEPTVVERGQVASVQPVDVSQMPPGLINSLNPQELRDLIAYLISGGNRKAEVYVGATEDGRGDDRR